ncbi:uncharacterized protein LOC126697131 [Quercus robur]|uniref:uncharacterized protein LOC126697131 n=1 Tax=Quercus robur TaxID=38942 RepID=UPI0021629617|nr:uncharacterized protein LOC126697131 [Quercus robur]
MNLHYRHVTDSDICDLCGEFPEDTVHAIWTCKEVAGVWSSLDWFHQAVPVQPVNYRELLARFMPSSDDYKAEIFAIAGWEAGSFLQEFLQTREVELSPPLPQAIQRWLPPDPNIYKINFDATVFRASNLAGVGVIVRDNRGDPIGALTMPVPFRQSVAELEAVACQRAVQFALEIGLTQVVVEGDSVTVIEALKNGTGQFANYGNILDDIRFQSTCFQFIDFLFTSRVCNSIADALAKKAGSGVGL